MPQENYIESIIIRQDNLPEKSQPSWDDKDVDNYYIVTGRIQLRQIIKSVRNSSHNKHDYVFKIDSINLVKE